MKPKNLVTVMLLVFVAASVAYLVVKEVGSREASPDDSGTGADGLAGTTSTAGADMFATGHHVVAYYFFGNVRCQTCMNIEAYTAETVATFTNELSTGELAWKTVNTDEKGNEHFVDDYELTSRSVVLVRYVDGKQTQWKNLPDIWDLVGDKVVFQQYISDETATFLDKSER